MSSIDTRIGHVVVGIEDDNEKNISQTTNNKNTPLVFKTRVKVERFNIKKWLQDNIMLLVTLSGVTMGIIIGEFNIRIL